MRAILVVVFALLTPALATAQKAKGRCSGDPADSLARLQAPIYRDCDVDESAELRGSEPRLNFRPSSSRSIRDRCLRAEVEFVVDTLGAPEPGSVHTRSSNNRDLEEAVLASVNGLRYWRAMLDGRPVRQIVVHKRSLMLAVVVSAAPTSGPPVGPGRTRLPPGC